MLPSSCQHIYGFNGSCSVLGHSFPGGKVFSLSNTFRLGPEVANLANM